MPSNDEPQSESAPNPLQAIRLSLERSAAEEEARKKRVSELGQLEERLCAELKKLVSFFGGLLDQTGPPRHDSFFLEVATALASFNVVLREYDRECPRFRIQDRLRKASRCGVTALEAAAALLLQDANTDPAEVAQCLRQFRDSRPHDIWCAWLTYILDQLLRSHCSPPERDSVPPDTTRDEWRKAEIAFGCILFADDSFAVLQESVDQAAAQVEDALRRGGHPPLQRPPCRVRDLIAHYDPRALAWYSSSGEPLGNIQTPEQLLVVPDTGHARQNLEEVWTAANVLQIALDTWMKWFVELRERGDADPFVALNCSDAARRSIAVLVAHRPNVPPFFEEAEVKLLSKLPPLPTWWQGSAAIGGDRGWPGIPARTRWQDDHDLYAQYFSGPNSGIHHAAALRASATNLIERLQSYPLSLLKASVPAHGRGIRMNEQPPSIGIVTALPLETAAIRAVIPGLKQITVPGAGAGRTYWQGDVQAKSGGTHRLVLAQAEMNNNHAAIRATLLLTHFPGLNVVMCGIAGGVPHPEKPSDHVRLGDVVVSNMKGVVQYDFVKRTLAGKRRVVAQEVRAAPHRPSALLCEACKVLEADSLLGQYPWESLARDGLTVMGKVRPDVTTDILASTEDPATQVTHPEDPVRRPVQPRVFLGPIASSNTLLKDPEHRDALRDVWGVKAVEMEGSGIQDATWTQEVGYLVVRGICDYCDSNKNDLWQPYAAVVAAAYVRALLESMPAANR